MDRTPDRAGNDLTSGGTATLSEPPPQPETAPHASDAVPSLTGAGGPAFSAPARPTRAAETLHLIVPVYNEAENFPHLIAQIEAEIPQPFVMHVVYDFDEDTTVPVARSLIPGRPWLRLTRNRLGRGVVCALRAGFDAVESGPALVVMADLSDDLSVVPRMLELYHDGCRIVCASRYMKGGRQIGGPWLKRTLSRTAGLLLRWLARFPTHDPTNNFRLYDSGLVRVLGIESTGGFEVALELTAKAHRAGVRIGQVPSTWHDRVAGQSRFRLVRWLPRYLRWYFVALGWSKSGK